MDDLISRQAAIDATWEEPTYTDPINVLTEVRDRIKKLPSAQPEIIQCKDCKFWQDQEEGVVEVPICARPQNKYEKHPMVMIINGDGFCSYAERRTDEQTV